MDKTNEPQNKPVLRPGEKGFSIVLFVLGLAALGLAIQLWMKVDAPKIASAAGIPVIVSSLWTILALWSIWDNRKYESPLKSCADTGEMLRRAVEYVMPLDVLVTIGFVLLYCILLYLKVSFYIVTPAFLFGMMCYLGKGNYLKNILWTAVVMGFIFVVFRLLFSVIFP